MKSMLLPFTRMSAILALATFGALHAEEKSTTTKLAGKWGFGMRR